MRLSNFLVCALLFSLFLSGCDEIFSPDISLNQIEVIAPADSLYTSREDINFWWEEDSDVESFRLRIWEIDQLNRLPVLDSSLSNNRNTLQVNPNRQYWWEVRGENEGSESLWTEGSLVIDTEAPQKAAALSLNGDSLNQAGPDTLLWRSQDLSIPGANRQFPVSDSVYLSARDDSSRFVFSAFWEAGEAKLWPIRNPDVPLSGPGRFYWKVVTFDKAGNRQSSDVFHFDIL